MKANGLLLTCDDIGQWRSANYGQDLSLRLLGSANVVVLRVTLVTSADWIESDPDSVATEGKFITSAAIEHQMQLAQLRTNMIFDIVSGGLGSSLPAMLTTEEDDKVQFFKGRFENQTRSIDSLPEVASFIKSELADVEDDPLGMIAVKHLKEPTGLPLPKNEWLPCLIKSESGVWDSVYRLNGSDVEVYVVGSNIEIGAGFQLLSRADSSYTVGTADCSI